MLCVGEGVAPLLDVHVSVLRLEDFGGASSLRDGPNMPSPVRLGKLLRAIENLG